APRVGRMSSGWRLIDSAVERTRSQNSTVICRREASCASASGTGALGALAAAPTAAIALSRRLRCPSGMPSFSRSPSVSSGRTSASIALSLKVASYWPSPRLWSQLPTFMIASQTSSSACSVPNWPRACCRAIHFLRENFSRGKMGGGTSPRVTKAICQIESDLRSGAPATPLGVELGPGLQRLLPHHDDRDQRHRHARGGGEEHACKSRGAAAGVV